MKKQKVNMEKPSVCEHCEALDRQKERYHREHHQPSVEPWEEEFDERFMTTKLGVEKVWLKMDTANRPAELKSFIRSLLSRATLEGEKKALKWALARFNRRDFYDLDDMDVVREIIQDRLASIKKP